MLLEPVIVDRQFTALVVVVFFALVTANLKSSDAQCIGVAENLAQDAAGGHSLLFITDKTTVTWYCYPARICQIYQLARSQTLIQFSGLIHRNGDVTKPIEMWI